MIKSIDLYLQYQNELSIIEIVGKSYNTLNCKLIEEIAAEDIQYSSFWVFETLHGKKVIDYLDTKFMTLLTSSERVFAEIAYLQDEKPILVLSQPDKLTIVGLLLITSEEGKLSTIEITSPVFYPTLRYTKTYPGLEL